MTRFIKKYLIRDDAENSLALRLQKVTIDDHMARLYGPAVVAKSQVERYVSVPGGAATCSECFVKCFLRVPRLFG